ncbi:GntR family transcriptional regulator [Roseomonas sp. AR75]|uniref:GntR family transcriptional regulator n=1 Tax=Roseomonas sp. AR75 TaxID=2562311 RepID=UPI001982035B|nr:GntR family transcriptional regulator [Roseomonas sp. AR75]
MKRAVSEAVLMGRWAPGAVLPGEVELAAQFGVAVGTVRRALAALVAEGMLARRPRLGTVVTGRSPEHSLRFFFRYFRLHGADGSLQTSRAVPLALEEEAAGADVARRLEVPVGAPLIRIRRLRVVGEVPVMLDEYRIPATRVPGFPRDAATLPELLYLRLLEDWGIRLTAVREELRADLATEEECRLLRLPGPVALLVIDAVCFDQAGQPALLATQRAQTAAHRYVNEVR